MKIVKIAEKNCNLSKDLAQERIRMKTYNLFIWLDVVGTML